MRALAVLLAIGVLVVLLVALDRRRLTLSPYAAALVALSELQSPHRHSP